MAQVLKGKIYSVNVKRRSLGVQGPDPETGMTEEISITIPLTAEFKNVGSLSELKPGNSVRVQAWRIEKNDENWEARTLEVLF